MRTNLIQLYMNNVPQPNRNLDIDYVLSNKTFIKPLQAKGHLINKNLFNYPTTMVKNTKYNINALNKAKNGIANDHELGKINDFGMKAGGLAIAAYLMTKRQTPLTKTMELVGLTSFFASMALWPKIAIQLPAHLIHGFNVRKEYEDSCGRKKMFFQDPQYIPWDLLDDKRINQIGNKMNVPKDMPNRREFIQEKMKKIAVQNNTMWMLTAGFATPIMSALICNACEKPVNSLLDKAHNWYADNLLIHMSEKYKNFKDTSANKQLETLLSKNAGYPVNEELSKKIQEIFTLGFDNVTATAITKDIKNLLTNNKYTFDKTILENIITQIKTTCPGITLPNNDIFTRSVENYLGKNLSEDEIKKVTHSLIKEIKNHLKENDFPKDRINETIHNLMDNSSNILSFLKSKTSTILDNEKIQTLQKLLESLTDFRGKNALLDKYIYLKAGAAPETAIANSFNEITGSLPKLLGISDKEISSARHERGLTGKLLREKLEFITSNDEEYTKVLETILEKISDLDNRLKVINGGSNSSYEAIVNSVFDDTANIIKENLPKTAESLTGNYGSLKNIQLSFAKNRLLGVRSSLYRFINTLDFYRRISTLQNIPALHNNMPKEVKEELIEICKELTINGSTSDFMTKFYQLRNPDPNMSDLSQVEVEAGKVINKYLGKSVHGGKVNLANDKEYFIKIMQLLFEDQLHPNTSEILSNFTIKDSFEQFRHDFAHEIGDSAYFTKPYHLLHGTESTASSYTKFLRVGMTPEKMLHNTIKRSYNTRKWLKMFGGFGAGLLSFTILAQFFFGKIENPKGVKND